MAYNQRLQSQNIVHLLQNRESGYARVGSQLSRISPLDYERRFYKCFTPCLSICSVEIPEIILRKFTPDGSQLLAFSDDLKSLHIYPYRGFSSAAVAELIREANVGTQECYKGERTNRLCRMIFERLFAIKDAKTIRLCRCLNGLYRLHREFSVFLANGKYVLVAAISDLRKELPIEGYPDSFDKLDVFSYVFFLVNLKRGVVRDSISLPQDSIAVSLNHGIAVSGSKVAIMSRLHQCIYVYKVSKGKLYKQETIESITHIKERIRSFLHRQIDLQKFYKIDNMIMERMQFMSDDLLLLCYEKRLRNGEDMPFLTPLTPPLYVFFKESVDEMVNVYPDTVADLLSIILLFYDEMHHFFGLFLDDFSTNSFVRNVVFRSQCLSPSPYLKSSDFSYEGWYMSPLEGPKYCSAKPIVFKDEETKTVKFRLFAKARTIIWGVPTDNAPELCTFIWHPFEPFVLSIQKCKNGYAQVNVHLYHHGTVVELTEPSVSSE